MSSETKQAIDRASREPAACSLDAAEGESRRERWLRLADRALIGKDATERGVRLRYEPGSENQAELQELATLERQCCGFAEWTVHPSERSLVLEVSTDSAQASVVWAMFELRG